MTTIASGEVKKIQCYHPTIIHEDKHGKLVKVNSHETVREVTYSTGFTRTNITTGEFNEFKF